MTYTFTRTYTRKHPANPYLVCSYCGAHVCYWREPLPEGPLVNYPCEHSGGYDDLCPSWGPVDGCRCAEHLGSVSHPLASDCLEHGPA